MRDMNCSLPVSLGPVPRYARMSCMLVFGHLCMIFICNFLHSQAFFHVLNFTFSSDFISDFWFTKISWAFRISLHMLSEVFFNNFWTSQSPVLRVTTSVPSFDLLLQDCTFFFWWIVFPTQQFLNFSLFFQWN